MSEQGQWMKVWRVPSTSHRGVYYTIGLNIKGFYGCSCPAWKFQKGDYTQRKDCKHIRDIRAGATRYAMDPNEVTIDDLKWII